MGNAIICKSDDAVQERIIKKILNCYSPSALKSLMIDETKISYLEFRRYPHLMLPIVSDLHRVNSILRYLMRECKDRYDLLMESRSKSISAYNEMKGLTLDKKTMPYILLVIHELSMIDKKDREELNYLLLNGEKVGIHLLMFSKFSLQNVSLGAMGDLVSAYNYLDLEHIFNNSKLAKAQYSYSDDMTGLEFEEFACQLLKDNGFSNVQKTKSSGDYGCDVVAYKDQIKYAIQCKKYSSPVGVSAVQEVIASRSIYKCHVAVVLTNNSFTNNAITLAFENKVLLWDGAYFNDLCKIYDGNQKYEEPYTEISLVDRLSIIENQIASLQPKNNTNETILKGTWVRDRDEYFIDAARFLVTKQIASIGMLQRFFKIGFNRAARIMDQLSEAGIVGPEEGTKPRKILMSEEELENYLRYYL